jgi:hypothetical protein
MIERFNKSKEELPPQSLDNYFINGYLSLNIVEGRNIAVNMRDQDIHPYVEIKIVRSKHAKLDNFQDFDGEKSFQECASESEKKNNRKL